MPGRDGLRREPQEPDAPTVGQEGGLHTAAGEQRLVKVFRIDLPDIVETGVEPRPVRMPDRDGLGADLGQDGQAFALGIEGERGRAGPQEIGGAVLSEMSRFGREPGCGAAGYGLNEGGRFAACDEPVGKRLQKRVLGLARLHISAARTRGHAEFLGRDRTQPNQAAGIHAGDERDLAAAPSRCEVRVDHQGQNVRQMILLAWVTDQETPFGLAGADLGLNPIVRLRLRKDS